MKIKFILLVVISVVVVGIGRGQSVQDFGTSTGIQSTSNSASTTFIPNPTTGTSYVRISNGGGGAINKANTPNPLGTGGVHIRASAPTTASINKISPIVANTAGKVVYARAKIMFGDSSGGSTATSGTWSMFIGNGAMYSDVNAFTGAQVFTGLRFVFGAGGAITMNNRAGGNWNTTGLATSSLASGIYYDFEIIGNNQSAGTVNYTYNGTSQSVAINTQDLYINGVLIGNDIAKAAMANNGDITSITIYGESSTSNVANIFIDDVTLQNTIPASIQRLSNPTPHDLSSSDYPFTTWANTSAIGSYPSNMIFHWGTVNSIDPTLPNTATQDYVWGYNYAAQSRVTGLGANGIEFLNTDPGHVSTSSGNNGEAVVAINATGRQDMQVSWTAARNTTNGNRYLLRGQYRIGNTGAYTDLPGAISAIEFNSTNAGPTSFGPITLPAACNNEPIVQVRWVYYWSGSGSGATDGIRLDDISITSTALTSCTAPSTQASALTTSNPTTDGFSAGWTVGNGSGTMLVVRPTAQTLAAPASGTAYTPNLLWASAAQIDANNRVVFRAAGSTAGPVTGLTAQTQYTITAYEYAATGNCYNTTSPVSSTIYTLSSEPSAQAAAFTATAISDSRIDLNFSAASSITNADGYIILRRADGVAPTTTGIVDGVASGSWSLPSGTSVVTNINSTATNSFSNTGLSASTTYCYLLVPYNWDGTNAGTYNYRTAAIVPSSCATTSAVAPEINIKQASTDIASGGSHTFASTAIGSTTDVVFTIENTGSANLTFTTPLTASGDYSIVAPFVTSPVTGPSGTTTFTVRFTPTAIGTRTGSVTITNNDTNEGSYVVNFTGIGTPCATSTITTDTTYGYTTNIPYATYQGGTPPPFPNSASQSVGVHNIIITDGVCADGLPTILNAITFSYTGTANTIRSAALFTTSNSKIADVTTVNTNSLVFSGLTLQANSGSTVQAILRVTFSTTVTDNQKLVFTVTSATAAGSNASSLFSSFGAVSDNNAGNDNNRIEVTATQLAFVQGPSNASNGFAMSPTVTVEAEDANGNRDLDNNTASITLTCSAPGAISSGAGPLTATTGLASFSSLIHGTNGTFTLTASASGLANSAASASYIISAITFTNNDFRTKNTTGTSTWGATTTWQRYNTTISDWEDVASAPGSTRRVFIRCNVTTVPSTTVFDLIIENGGTLTSTNAMSVSNSLLIESGGRFDMGAFLTMDNDLNGSTFEIEDNGTFEYANTNSSPLLFQGTENFHPNSNFIINNWDNGTDFVSQSVTSRAITANSYNNANTGGMYSALFGNLYYRDNSGSDARLVSTAGALSFNLTHGNLEIESTLADADEIVLMEGGQTIGIGGNVIVKDGYFVFARGSSSAQVVNIEGDLIIQGVNNAAAVIGGVFNSSTTNVNLKGNLNVSGANRLLSIDLTNCFLNFVGPSTSTDPQTVDFDAYSSGAGPYNAGISFSINDGSYTKIINQNWQLGDDSDVTVRIGGTLDFNFAAGVALNITEAGPGASLDTDFVLESRGVLKITSPLGIDKDAADNVGNIRADVRTFSNTGIYHYIGQENQVTGDGLPTTNFGKRVIVEMSNLAYTLTPPSVIQMTDNDAIGNGILGGLEIRQGTVIGTTTADFTGTGILQMTGGLYQISAPTATSTVPRLTGDYTLTGGVIDLNANDDQTLRGSRDYFNLQISSSNTSGVDDKTVTFAFTVANNLEISGTPIFDISNNGMTGAAGITMTGGRLRMSKLNDALPELLGTATNYALSGGVIEFYGSSGTTQQKIRGAFGASSNKISYRNIEINAATANYNSTVANAGNVDLNSSFTITGIMNVNSPAVLRMDKDESIDGIGTFNINSGAGLLYGGSEGGNIAVEGLESSGTTVDSGNIRTSNRSFSIGASYGFVSPGNMPTGTGLPATVAGLYVYKTNASDQVTLTNANVEVTSNLSLNTGIFVTGACSTTPAATPLLTMRAGTSYAGGSANSYVSGIMRKIGNTAFTFPIGGNGQYAPLSISGSSSATDTFTTCYNRSNPNTAFGTAKAANVGDVSTCEHWHLSSVPTNLNTQITLDLNTLRCAINADDCRKVIHWSGSQWQNLGNTASSATSLTSAATTARGPISYATGISPVLHVDPVSSAVSTNVGFGTHEVMKTGFPSNIPGGFIAFDTKSKGFVIPRIANLGDRPAGAAEGLLIYYIPSNCMQLYRDGDWHCIKAVCE